MPKFESDGEFAFSYAYSVRYTGVPVTLEHQCGTGDIEISRLRPGDGTLNALLGSRRDAVCDKGRLPNVRVVDGLAYHGTVPIYNKPFQVAGVNLYPPQLNFLGEFSRDENSVGDPEPLRALICGESFSVSSRQRTYQGTSNQSTARATTSVTVTFNRAR